MDQNKGGNSFGAAASNKQYVSGLILTLLCMILAGYSGSDPFNDKTMTQSQHTYAFSDASSEARSLSADMLAAVQKLLGELGVEGEGACGVEGKGPCGVERKPVRENGD